MSGAKGQRSTLEVLLDDNVDLRDLQLVRPRTPSPYMMKSAGRRSRSKGGSNVQSSRDPNVARNKKWKALDLICCFFFVVYGAGALVLALSYSIMQYVKYERPFTIDGVVTSGTNADDTDMRHSFAFIIGGPSDGMYYYVFGALLASVFARAMYKGIPMGRLGNFECVFIAIIALIALGFGANGMGKFEKIDSEISEIRGYDASGVSTALSTGDDYIYARFYHESPLTGRVYAFSQIMLMFMIFLVIALLFIGYRMWTNRRVVNFQKLGRADEVPESYSSYAKSGKLRPILRGAIYAVALLGNVVILCQLVLSFMTLHSELLSTKHTYWAMLSNTVHFNLAFFLYGWLSFFIVGGTLWFSGFQSTMWRRVVIFVSIVVSLLALAFSIAALVDIVVDCEIDEGSSVTEVGSSDLRSALCEKTMDEREESPTARDIHLVVASCFVGALALTAALLIGNFVFDFTGDKKKGTFSDPNGRSSRRAKEKNSDEERLLDDEGKGGLRMRSSRRGGDDDDDDDDSDSEESSANYDDSSDDEDGQLRRKLPSYRRSRSAYGSSSSYSILTRAASKRVAQNGFNSHSSSSSSSNVNKSVFRAMMQ